MGQVSKVESTKRRLDLLTELYVDGGKLSNLDTLRKKYGVSYHTINVLLRNGMVKKRGGVYWWNYNTAPDKNVVRLLLIKERELRSSYTKKKESRDVEQKTTTEKKEPQFGLTKVVKFSVLGNKYGVKQNQLEDFVKEAIKISLENGHKPTL